MFGLVAGSLIVIASFVVRDALPHLSAIDGDSRLARLSRAQSPSAWGRWCADAGLVLAAAGTLVLLITVAALLTDLSDAAGNIVVGLSAAVAVVASVLGVARLGQRLRVDTERELRGEALLVAQAPARTTWDDDLPIWSPSTPERQQTSGVTLAEVPPNREEDVAAIEEPGDWGWSATAAGDAPPWAPLANGGLFSSPLLADIGLSPVEEAIDDGYRSPLLSDLLDNPIDDGDESDTDAGSDLLIDEAPAPIGSTSRLRDEMDDR